MALETGDSLYWKTKIDNTGLKTGAVQAKGILRGLTRSITGMDVFAGLAIGATLVFSKITKQVYNFSKDFETAMKEVQTISKAVQDNFEGMSKEIIEMSRTVPDNAQKLTKALYQIVSAGYDGAEAMNILRTSAELAVATVTDTFTAADALTYVMNAYGIAAGTAAEISDKLFTIIKLGKVKMDELGPTISMVTGLAAEAGLGFNELAAMYAEAVKKIQPHIVSTGIRGILTAMLRVSKGTGAAADKARELGIEFDISALKSKGFKQILNEIIIATKGNEGALMELFPNVRGLIGLLAIMTDEGEGFYKTLDEIENSLGNNTKAFKIMMETTENQWAIMKNNIMAKLKPLGDEMLAFMNNIARQINYVMTGANDSLSKLSRTYVELTDTLYKKQGRIDNLVKTIEDLRGKTELTKEETIQLKAAEEALAVYFPTLDKAARFAGAGIDVLTLAKQGSFDLSVKIMELELERAKIEKKQVEIELMRWEMEEDASNRTIRSIQRQMEVRKKMIQLELGGFKGALLSEAQLEKIIKMDSEYIGLILDLTFATENATLKENDLRLRIEETTLIVDAKAEALKRLIELQERPIVTPKPDKDDKDPDKVIDIALTDDQVEEVKNKLEYMADQYKSYWKIVAQFGEKYVEEHNAQLAEDAGNYSGFLSDMLSEYSGIAELTKEIMLDIAEYNSEITEKRKKAEEEYFDYITEAREKDLESERKRFEAIIEDHEEGSAKYLALLEKHNKNILEINEKYDKKIAEGKLTIFKENLERQIGETDIAYKQRLEIARKALGEETKINEKYFEFVEDKINKIIKIEEEKAKKDRDTLESYLEAYQTTEEKIISIHKKTNELLELTDNEYERDRLRIIERQLIAEVRFSEARQKINDKIAEYGERLNNQQLKEYIIFLEEMKIEYSEYADAVLLINKEIAEAQKNIWENTRDEINQTVNLLHSLGSAIGEIDTELGQMVNNLADVVSGIGQLFTGFATGNIFGILGGIISLISSIFTLFTVHHSDVEEIEEELHQITLELQEQQHILNQAVGTAKLDAIQNVIDLLNEQISVYNAMIEAEKEAYGQFLWWTWSETDQADIQQWLSTIQNINAEIYNLQQQYSQILTGTTSEAIADAIAEGFAQGLDSAQVFADTFNDMIRKAVIDAFKRTIVTRYLQHWLASFTYYSAGGLTAAEIEHLAKLYLSFIQAAETQWEAVQDILAAVGIDIGGMGTFDDVVNEVGEAIREIAGMTEESIADSIAEGFSSGLTSAEVFADTFNDMMQRAIISAFKETIITRYIQDWFDQFETLFEGGLTAEEILILMNTYQSMVEAAGIQWEAMEAILEAAGISLDRAKRPGLTGAIAGITEETAGLLAGQFQAIRINTVEMLSNMEDIIIINARIADNTEYNKYLENIAASLAKPGSAESDYLRSIGGA